MSQDKPASRDVDVVALTRLWPVCLDVQLSEGAASRTALGKNSFRTNEELRLAPTLAISQEWLHRRDGGLATVVPVHGPRAHKGCLPAQCDSVL